MPEGFSSNNDSEKGNGLVNSNKAVNATVALSMMAGLVAGCRPQSRNTEDIETGEDNKPKVTQTYEGDICQPSEEESYTEDEGILSATPSFTPTSTLEQTPTSSPTTTSTREPTTTPTRLPESEIPEVRGYDIGNWMYDSELGMGFTTVEVYDSRVEKVEVTDEGLVMTLSLQFYNVTKTVTIKSESFTYLKVDPKTNDTIMQLELNKDTNNIGMFLNKNRKYDTFLFSADYPRFKSDFIESFINGEVDIDFSIYAIVEGLR